VPVQGPDAPTFHLEPLLVALLDDGSNVFLPDSAPTLSRSETMKEILDLYPSLLVGGQSVRFRRVAQGMRYGSAQIDQVAFHSVTANASSVA
jgi:hypothetical protein